VPVASYLSGGLDSSSIAAVAVRHLGRITTFTGGFDLSSASGLELGFDERANSEMLSNLLKTEHYEIVLHAGDMEQVMPELIWHLEDLRVGQCYPNYYVARLAGRFVTATLCGSKPASDRSSISRLRSSKPAPTISTSASATSDTTRMRFAWRRLRPAPLVPRSNRPSSNQLRATCGYVVATGLAVATLGCSSDTATPVTPPGSPDLRIDALRPAGGTAVSKPAPTEGASVELGCDPNQTITVVVFDERTGQPREAVFVVDRAGLIQHAHLGSDRLGTAEEWIRELRQVR